jgi:hypothetical protein
VFVGVLALACSGGKSARAYKQHNGSETGILRSWW